MPFSDLTEYIRRCYTLRFKETLRNESKCNIISLFNHIMQLCV